MPVRIGFIGTGGIANMHFNMLAQIEDAQPVAFCDVAQDKAEAAARRFEGTAYTSIPKMLETEALDAVYVCLPPHVHKNVEVLVAQKGCAMLVEKPLANDLKTGETIAQAIQDAGVLSSVGYHFRHYAATERMQKILTAKGAPEVSMSYGRWMGGFPGVGWWRKMEMSGGQLNEQATHIVDLARYLLGDIRKVYCASALREMDKIHEGTTVADVTALTVEYESGAIGYIATSCLVPGIDETGLSMVTPSAIYDLNRNNLSIRRKGEVQSFSENNNAYLEEDRAFIKAVKTGKGAGIRSTYADALKTHRVTMAANLSAKTGKPVMV